MPLYSTETEAQKRKRLPKPALRAEHDSIRLFLPPQGAFVYPGPELSQNRKGNIWRRQCLRDYKPFITPGEHSSWKEKENRGGWGRTEESALFSGSTQLEIGLQITVILNKYGSHLRGLKGGLWAHRLCWGSEKCYDENWAQQYKPVSPALWRLWYEHHVFQISLDYNAASYLKNTRQQTTAKNVHTKLSNQCHHSSFGSNERTKEAPNLILVVKSHLL